MSSEPPIRHRSGFVAVVGRPNVGKSTLVNRIMGQELSIVTPKAQTTRHRISAIYSRPGVQMILQDTPGIHDPKTVLNRALVDSAVKTLQETDFIVLLVTPGEKVFDDDRVAVDFIKSSGTPAVLVINKIDLVRPAQILPVIDTYSRMHSFTEVVPVSALTGDGMDKLLEILIEHLPEGPPLFPEDDISDLPVRFFVSEIIREQIFKLTGEEIPYQTAVMVESFQEQRGSVLIHADIHVEKDSQKRIIIGKGGSMIKKIGTDARMKIEEFIQSHVRLELFVKVTPKWTRDRKRLEEFGYWTS